MRRHYPAVVALLVPFLLAMGGGGSSPVSDTIPRPKEDHRAELRDRQGVVTRVERFSCNGKTFLPLDHGEGTLMVPFSKIEAVTVGDEAGTRVSATIRAEGGRTLEGELPRTLQCTGVTDFGNYQVEVRGLREVLFLP